MAARDPWPDRNIAADPEITLIRRICSGEKSVFYELIRPYEHGVYLTAFAILRNQADAEDAAQEALLKAFTHLEQFRSDDKFKSWLMLIVINEARMRKRKDHQQLYESIDGAAPANDEGGFMPRQFADWRDLPSEVYDKKEIRIAVQRALDSLPSKYRETFLLRDIQHLSVAETAKILGLSVAAVKTQLHRARLQVREQLAPAFRKHWTEKLPFLKGRNPW